MAAAKASKMTSKKRKTKGRVLVTVSLSPTAVALADQLAGRDGLSRSAWLEQRIRQSAREVGIEVLRRRSAVGAAPLGEAEDPPRRRR